MEKKNIKPLFYWLSIGALFVFIGFFYLGFKLDYFGNTDKDYPKYKLYIFYGYGLFVAIYIYIYLKFNIIYDHLISGKGNKNQKQYKGIFGDKVKMNQEKANKAIKNAWVGGLISGVLTLIITIISVMKVRILDFNLWNLIDVILIFGLTFGVYKKSRICSTLLFMYYIGNRIMFFMMLKNNSNLLLAILFGYIFFQGIRGTFYYHKYIKTIESSEPSTNNY